jgi:hypothetical protein
MCHVERRHGRRLSERVFVEARVVVKVHVDGPRLTVMIDVDDHHSSEQALPQDFFVPDT